MGRPGESNDGDSLSIQWRGDWMGEFYPLELDRFDLRNSPADKILPKCSLSEYDERYTKQPINVTEAFIQEMNNRTSGMVENALHETDVE